MESYLNLLFQTIPYLQPLRSRVSWLQLNFFSSGIPWGLFWAFFPTPLIDLPFISFSWKLGPQFCKYVKNKNWSHLEWGHTVEFILRSNYDTNNSSLLCNMLRIQVWPGFNLLASRVVKRRLSNCTPSSPSQVIPTLDLPVPQDQLSCSPSATGLGPTHLVATGSYQIWYHSLLITPSNSTSQKMASAKRWFPTSINTKISFTNVYPLIQVILLSTYYVQALG